MPPSLALPSRGQLQRPTFSLVSEAQIHIACYCVELNLHGSVLSRFSMRRAVLLLSIVQFILHSSLASPRLSVADAPDEINCSAHAQPPFIALVDVLGIDPNAVAVHVGLGPAHTFHFIARVSNASSSRLRRILPSHPLVHLPCPRP